MVDGRVSVMTWNIWWRFGPRWRDRQSAIRSTIERYDPGVVALQEVWSTDGVTQADELARALGMHAVFVQPSYPVAPPDESDPDHRGVGLGIALLSRWPVLEHAAVPMPARHRDWEPVTLAARVAHPCGPMPVIVTCLEYATAYNDDRVAQAALLADLATGPHYDGPCPVLVAGDLNAAADSPILRPLRDVLTDAWTAGGGAVDAVTLPSSHPSAALEAGPELIDQRIDHVFFRPGREGQQVVVEGLHVTGDVVNGVHPSDHRAVVADLRWRG